MIAFSALCKLHAEMFGIYVLHSARATPHRVSPALSGHCTAPLWSPKAEYLLFGGAQREYPGQANIYLCDAETFIPRTITPHSANNHAMIWISDEHIAFSSNQDKHYYLYTMRIDGTNAHTILDFDLFSHDISWSKDRKYFIVTSRDDTTQLNLFDVNGNQLRQWPHDSHPKYNPMWSPDGRYIAFTSDSEQTTPLYMMRFDGTAIQHIGDVWHDWRYDDRYFTWSPDSRKIAYIGVDAHEGWPTLYSINPDGTQRQYITLLNPGDETGEMRPSLPVWSPDSRQLLFSSYDGDEQSKLYLTTIDDSVPECLESGATPFELIDDLAWGI